MVKSCTLPCPCFNNGLKIGINYGIELSNSKRGRKKGSKAKPGHKKLGRPKGAKNKP